MYSQIILIGRLTRDPETRETKNGGTMTTARLAYQTHVLGKEEDNYVDLVLFGKSAAVFANYAKRGRRVLIEGQLRVERTADSETDQMRERVRIFVSDFKLMDSAKSSSRVDDDDDDDDDDWSPAQETLRKSVRAGAGSSPRNQARYFDEDADAYDPFID